MLPASIAKHWIGWKKMRGKDSLFLNKKNTTWKWHFLADFIQVGLRELIIKNWFTPDLVKSGEFI